MAQNFYLIGLIGTLGSGKSTVRRILEEFGARGIDADALAHVTMRRGTPTWRAIVRAFGEEILMYDGRIDRRALSARVFADLDALHTLENIVHPAVVQATKQVLRETTQPVVVLEAIKLFEAGMDQWCDALWAVTCAPETQIERVMRSRQWSVDEARARLDAQGAFEEKLRRADVVIDNNGDAAATRAQVARLWKSVRPETARDKSEWLWDSARVVVPPAPVIVTPQVTAPPSAPTIAPQVTTPPSAPTIAPQVTTPPSAPTIAPQVTTPPSAPTIAPQVTTPPSAPTIAPQVTTPPSAPTIAPQVTTPPSAPTIAPQVTTPPSAPTIAPQVTTPPSAPTIAPQVTTPPCRADHRAPGDNAACARPSRPR
jgi:dephospho-CoA kinase